jgi:DNA-binding beta-propeller fold protein YncE
VRTELVVALGERSYAVERPWGLLPDGMQLESVSSVAVDSRDHVYVCQRAEPPVLVFDSSGNYLRSFGAGAIADANGIAAGGDRVYLVDRDAHQVLVFGPDGTLELSLGERHQPRFQAPFNHPTDAALAPNGDIYVADGYANASVHRFSADGEWLGSWGRPGKGPGEFVTPHALWVDREGRVLVVDRENDRVQVFDAEGRYLDEWADFFHPMDLYVDVEGLVYVTDQVPRLSLVSSNGALRGRCRPVPAMPHGVWGDSRGHLYLAEVAPMNQITKLVRAP